LRKKSLDLALIKELYNSYKMVKKDRERSAETRRTRSGGKGRAKVKFEIYGEEMIEKEVKQSGNSGRIYLPPEWIGKHVKIIRID